MRNRNNNEGRRGSGKDKRDFVSDGNNALYKYADFTRRRIEGVKRLSYWEEEEEEEEEEEVLACRVF